MNKRLLTMVTAVILMLVMYIPASLAGETMYVYTENGKGLTVRSEPNKGDNAIGSLAYGASVYVDHYLSNGWACIVWGSYGDAYGMTRASGWAPMRWAPSKSTEQIATYKQDDQLLVIAELKDWYQVEDPNTGAVGFMHKQFLTKAN